MFIPDKATKKSLISLTSLIDVVFILLVFFMLTSSFIKWNYIQLGTEGDNSVSIDNTQQSLVYVGFNKEYRLNDETMSLDLITQRIKMKVHTDNNHPILIQPVDALPLQELINVLERIGSFAGKNISLVHHTTEKIN